MERMAGEKRNYFRRARVAAGVTLLALLCLLSARTFFGVGFVDDSYISLRYSRNFAEGRGLVFNPGERVEGYTCFLWVIVNGLLARAGAEPAASAAVLCVLLAAGTAGLVSLFPGGPEGRAGGVIAPLLLLANASFVFWSLSGMEVALFALMLTLSAALFVRECAGERPISLAWASVTLACMTRPEGVILAPLNGLYIILFARRRGLAVRWVLLPLVLLAPYIGARWAYYGHPFPNTYYAKVGGGSAALLARGLAYAGRYALVSGAGAAVIIAAARGFRALGAAARYSLMALLLFGAAFAAEGGDHFALYRFFAPLSPLLALLMADLVTRSRRRAWAAAQAIYFLLAVSVISYAAFAQGSLFRGETDYTRGLARIGRWAKGALPGGSTIALLTVGAVPYYSDLMTIDMSGLTDERIAHAPATLGKGYPGHERSEPGYVMSREPDYVFLLPFTLGRPLGEAAARRFLWGRANRELAALPEFTARYRYRVEKLGDSGKYVGFWEKSITNDQYKRKRLI